MVRQKSIRKRTILRMRQVRRARELTMEQLAELSGVNRCTIGAIERGNRPQLDTAIKLAKALNEADVASLFDYVEVPAS